MISVVYCTKSKDDKFKEHIKKTCGIKDVEIIEYVNPNGEPLTKFYNRGLEESTNDVTIFCHNDLIYNKNGWAKKILDHFNESDYGILGVAGTTHIPESGKWWEDPTKMVGCVKHSHEGKTWESKYSNNFGDKIIETVMVDGLFIAVHKQRIQKNFDEDIKGLHFYDIDFSFNNHLHGTKVGVVFDVKVTHKSIGETDEKWEENKNQFVQKYAFDPRSEENEALLPYHIEGKLMYDDKEVHIPEENQPEVLIVIPTAAELEMVKNTLTSIKNVSSYQNYKVVVANTITEEPERKDELAKAIGNDERFNFVDEEYESFAKINNKLVRDWAEESTELILFCNDDVELINDAISRMVETYMKNKKTCGTIGCRLHYKDNKVQHSGVNMLLGQDGRIHLGHYGHWSYYNYRDNIEKDIFGNTGAFMLMPKSLFNKIGGFNEKYEECFEDVQLSVDCIRYKRKNIFDGRAVTYHYESQSRNQDEKKMERETRDYTEKIIPYIINSPETYGYFMNIKRREFEMLLAQYIQKQKQEQAQQNNT